MKRELAPLPDIKNLYEFVYENEMTKRIDEVHRAPGCRYNRFTYRHITSTYAM